MSDEGEIVMVRRKRTVKTVTEVVKVKPPPKVKVPVIKNIRFTVK